MDFYVYQYSRPNELLPFYIGKGRGSRATSHLSPDVLASRDCYFYRTLRKMLATGVMPEVKILKINLTEQDAFSLEIKLIAIYGRLCDGTGCLTNLTWGGEGTSGHSPDLQQRANISAGVRTARARPVESFSRATRQPIKQYDAITDVARDGFIVQNVLKVCKGIRHHSGGLGWRYTT